MKVSCSTAQRQTRDCCETSDLVVLLGSAGGAAQLLVLALSRSGAAEKVALLCIICSDHSYESRVTFSIRMGKR